MKPWAELTQNERHEHIASLAHSDSERRFGLFKVHAVEVKTVPYWYKSYSQWCERHQRMEYSEAKGVNISIMTVTAWSAT